MGDDTKISRRGFIAGATGMGMLGVAGLGTHIAAATLPHQLDTSKEAQAHAIQTMLETDNGRNLPFETREAIRRVAGFGTPTR